MKEKKKGTTSFPQSKERRGTHATAEAPGVKKEEGRTERRRGREERVRHTQATIDMHSFSLVSPPKKEERKE